MKITTRTYPARFTGRCGPKGTGEFYTGVTPGAEGEARCDTYHDGAEYWSFHLPGGAWLVCKREDVELTVFDPATQPAKAAKAGYYRAVFPKARDAAAFYRRLTQGDSWGNGGPGKDWATNVKLNRKGGRIVTFERDRDVADEPSPVYGDRGPIPGWYVDWQSKAELVGFYGSSFGEPPTGAGRFTATLNGMPCPASM